AGALRSRRLRSPPPRWGSRAMSVVPLEVQTGFARGFRQRLDPAVIDVATAVENDVGDALFDGTFGNQLANLGSSSDVRALGTLATFQRRGRSDSDALRVVDDLCRDVLVRTED